MFEHTGTKVCKRQNYDVEHVTLKRNTHIELENTFVIIFNILYTAISQFLSFGRYELKKL